MRVVTEYLAPHQIKNADGSLGGYSVEIVERLLLLTNQNSTIEVLPWARAYRTALNKPNIMIFSIARTALREDMFEWVGALKPYRIYMWGLASKFSETLTSIAQAKQYRISVAKSNNSALFLQDQKFPHLFLTTLHTQNVGMLLKGRADIILSSKPELAQVIKKKSYHPSKFIQLQEVVALRNDLSVAFSKGSDKELIKRFRKAFKQMKDSGEIERIKAKWNISDE